MSASADSAELWGDYLSECDEHLSATRELLGFGADAAAAPTRDDVNSLFRHFHTLKGLSGIAGVPAAEQVAHAVETYLAAVRRDRAELNADGVRILIDAAAIIESVIAAHPTGDPPAGLAPLLARIESALSSGAGVPAGTAATSGPAGVVWRIGFTPSAELSARGVTVTTVRERLQGIGTILKAEPTPQPGGTLRFTFLLDGPADFTAFAPLEADGISVARDVPPDVPRPPAATPVGHRLGPANVVRVDLGRLDDLMQTVAELVLSRSRLEVQLWKAMPLLPTPLRRELEETGQGIARQLRSLREGVVRARLVPVRDVFGRMKLVAHDAARDVAKEIELVLGGEQTEVDKFVVERMADPLLHLVRNAVSHGLETSRERAAGGKPARGRLDVRAATAGSMITVEVEDDGRGIDAAAVFERARRIGVLPPGRRPDPAMLLDVLCTPGFSTKDVADRTSGRGVGLDVVRGTAEDLGGSLEMTTAPGRGTCFSLRLPLTLAIADVFTARVGDELFALPQTAVRHIVWVEAAAITVLERNELIGYEGGVIPLFRLADLFKLPRSAPPFHALVVGDAGRWVAVAVDRVLGLHEAVVRPVVDPLLQVPGVSGATELGGGRAVLVLDAAGLARFGRSRGRNDSSTGG